MDWRHAAACRDSDPELHFPIGTGEPAERQIEKAKAVCRRCPEWVKAECLTFAVESGASGVWAGTTEDERRGLTVTPAGLVR